MRADRAESTLAYVAPEQTRRTSHAIDHRSDLYAVGVILYQMVTGLLPFDSESAVGFATAHLTQEVPSFRARRPDCRASAQLERLVMRALAKDPDERPQTAEEFIQLLTPEGERVEGESFSYAHDDATIAAQQYRTPNDSDVFLIDASTGAREKILPRPGASAAGYSGFEWSLDNQRLFLVTNQGGEFGELAVYDRRDKSLSVLSRHIPWDIENFSLSADGKQLMAVVNNNGRDEVRLFDAASGKELPRPDIPAGSIGGGRWHELRQEQLAFSLNSPQSPGDVYSLDASTGKTERWTVAASPSGVRPDTFVSPELVQIRSFDGRAVSGWLFLPDAAKFPGKRPVLVGFHGGPEGQSTVRFMGRYNYFLNEMGIAVLLPNVRGSTGYGKTYLDLDNGFKRKDSVKDGGAFLSWVASHPRLDARRIAGHGALLAGTHRPAGTSACCWRRRSACGCSASGG